MGRVVMLAARRPFRAVVGVEISPALVEIARENLATARDRRRVARDVRIVRADAAAYAFPRGDLVVYLYNPFAAPVLERVLARLRIGGRAPRGRAALPHARSNATTVDASGAFELIADLGFGLVYRLSPPLVSP